MIVSYKNQLLDVRNGDIVAFRNNFRLSEPITWLSMFVRFFTRSYFNHCAVVVDFGGHMWLNEAVNEGVITRLLPYNLERTHSEIMILRPITALDDRAFALRAEAKVKAPYDYINLIVFQPIFRLTGIWLGGHRDKRFVCSKYAAYCHNLPGFGFYSVKELIQSNLFTAVFYEQQSSVVKQAA